MSEDYNTIVKYYSVPTMAKKFSIARHRIYRWIQRGKLEARKKENSIEWEIPETEIPTFIRRIKGWEMLTGGNK